MQQRDIIFCWGFIWIEELSQKINSCLPILFRFVFILIFVVGRLVEKEVKLHLLAAAGDDCDTPDTHLLSGRVCHAAIIELECRCVLLHAFLSLLVIHTNFLEPFFVLLQIRAQIKQVPQLHVSFVLPSCALDDR